MNRSRRLGILGGMFDPIHHGHLDTLAAAERALHLTELLVVPSKTPPHRPQPIASTFHRFAMVSMAVAGRPGWRALDLELGRTRVSYTSDTLRHFHTAGYRPTELCFVVGADAFLEIATWKDYPALFDLAHFAVVARPGVSVSELPTRFPLLASRMPGVDGAERRLSADATVRTFIFLIDETTADVSSTAIRQARLDHRTIAGMVPACVQQHIEQHGLYEDPTLTAGGDPSQRSTPAGGLHGKD